MNTSMKKVLVAGLFAVSVGLCGKAQAAASDTKQISVTPSVTFGVQITSVNANGYQFGTVALGATTESTAAITLTNTGTIPEYFAMAITNTSGNWVATSTAAAVDNFRMIGEFSSTQPDMSSGFNTADALTPSSPGTAATLYGQASAKTSPVATQKLWLRLEMPTNLIAGGSGTQTMTLTVTGQAS